MTQIRRAVFIGGRADRTEDDLHMRQNFGNRSGEVQSPCFHSTTHERIQTRLIDGDFAITQTLHLRLVDIDTVDLNTEVSKARGTDQPDIANPYDCNGHNATPYII